MQKGQVGKRRKINGGKLRKELPPQADQFRSTLLTSISRSDEKI